MPIPTPTRTVLVIDDEEPIRTAVRFILEEEGYAVLEAPDGRAGLELLRESDRPLVVLLDLRTPNLSGSQLLHTVAGEPVLADRHAFILFSASQEFSAPIRASYGAHCRQHRRQTALSPLSQCHAVALTQYGCAEFMWLSWQRESGVTSWQGCFYNGQLHRRARHPERQSFDDRLPYGMRLRCHKRQSFGELQHDHDLLELAAGSISRQHPGRQR